MLVGGVGADDRLCKTFHPCRANSESVKAHVDLQAEQVTVRLAQRATQCAAQLMCIYFLQLAFDRRRRMEDPHSLIASAHRGTVTALGVTTDLSGGG